MLLGCPLLSAQRPVQKATKPPVAWWSYKSPALTAIPQVKNVAWVSNPIDAFVLERLEQKGLKPATPADRRSLIRRVSVDLIGLPPTPERVDMFVSDPDPNAYAKLVDELLASPQYGERWGRHWLDVVRYADSGGYETDIYYRNAWRYRDYVIQSFNADKPYNRFVQEQIAGDEIWPIPLELEGSYVIPEARRKALEARTGTGLYTFYPQIHESNMDGKKIAYERLTDWVDTTSAVFMGTTLGCARCHNHKFDPFTQKDYFQLQAIFAASREEEVPTIDPMGIADYKQHYPRVIAADEARKSLQRFIQGIGSRPMTATEQQERSRLNELLASAVLGLVPQTAQGIPFDGLFEMPVITALGHVDPAVIPPIQLLRRGELTLRGERVRPGLPGVLQTASKEPPLFDNPFSYRTRLAHWLTRPEHPLTSRVIVNRVWQWHFGRGLVATPNDFGKMGAVPTHPELLDWLAGTFVAKSAVKSRKSEGAAITTNSDSLACDWSLKKLHRLIVLSNTYCQESRVTNALATRLDPENKLLWRMDRRRLEGEAIWDSLHAIAGNLNLKMGGRPVVPPLSAEEKTSLRDTAAWTVSSDPAEHNRRGIYILARRNFRFPLFEVFDAPGNAVSCPRRDVTTVAPQSLWFLNNHVIDQQARVLAARLAAMTKGKEEKPETEVWIDQAWRLTLNRAPTQEEKSESQNLFTRLTTETAPMLTGLPPELSRLKPERARALCRLCLSLFNLSEFLYVD